MSNRNRHWRIWWFPLRKFPRLRNTIGRYKGNVDCQSEIVDSIKAKGYWDATEGQCSRCMKPSVWFVINERLCKKHFDEVNTRPIGWL